MLRKLLMASAGAVALATSAMAADLPSRAPPPVYVPPVPIFTWTGVYVGGQIGYGWGTANGSLGDYFGDFISASTSYNGVIGGAHVGYNLQLNQFVIGLEGDVDGTSMSKSGTHFFTPYGGLAQGSTSFNVSHSVEGSIRGRLGYAWDRVLVYATGGVAFAGFNGNACSNFNTIDTGEFFGGCASNSGTRVGWTVGGGLEYAVTNNWSVRAEYRYSDFGHATQYANSWDFPTLGALGAYVNRHFTENRVQVGFSYKFDLAPPAPVVAKY
ncbi:outer membrane protein [Methylocapsa palsarum]|uniref:Outer membrane immunogenic protein n=1 Tax=Methylocapsa palsarum TaxID=1612308 RepID=A0A1I3WS67_9HYPH|nr:outer membrane protein [Methylocapsa palsarum]SFK10043.1 outer membrane immunogenic protein [Methylocapsa palsarum]